LSATINPMDRVPSSPRILEHTWGKLIVDDLSGGEISYKDAKLYPGGSRKWDWQETGTEHSPGVQLADVEELLKHGANVVVLSRGVYGRLRVMEETQHELERRGIGVHVARTKEAIDLYNQLREEEAVGALIHSTC